MAALAPTNDVSVHSPFSQSHDVADNPRLQAAVLLIIVCLGTAMIMLLGFMFKDIGNEGSLTHDLLMKSLAWKRDQRLLSEAYRRAMNRTADPCADFEGFVCGTFDSSHVFQDMQSRALAEAGRQLAQTLVPAVEDNGVNLTAVQKAASLFQLCVRLPSLEDDAAPKLSALLRQLGLGWPPDPLPPGFVEETPAPTRTEAEALLFKLIALSLRWRLHTLFRCQVETERKPHGVLVLTVGISDELSEWLDARNELHRLETYNEALITVVAAFRWPGGRPQASSVVRSVASADRLLSALISNTSLWSGTHISAETWRQVTSRVAGRQVTPSVATSTLLTALEYFVLKMTDDAAVTAAWLVLRKLAPLSVNSSPDEVEALDARSGHCMNLINREMPLAVASAYARASDTAANTSTSAAANVVIHEVASKMAELLEASGRFRMAESVRTIQVIFLLPMEDEVVDALYESVPVADARRTLFGSLAQTTSTMAERRLAALGSRIDHLSLPLFARPLDSRLRYVESLHALLVPMAVLEPPVFRQTLTNSVNYGSFGRLIAEVLIETFVRSPYMTKPCSEAASNFTATLLRYAAVERPVRRAFQHKLAH
ncbi:neprilysin-1 [Rhipicephalus sanguineus]|uniref:neprilysin-1 n=1 Tax=Rhipicephalus sanguineus TaxID=34632 RepID=UPI0018950366|nr:neprilysin-1 [Rhipicephalus sanguineus]